MAYKRLLVHGLVLGLIAAPALAWSQQTDTASWRARVESALGRAGVTQPGGVIRFGIPRTDLAVTLDGTPLKPAFALGGWVAFKPGVGDSALVMGDLVLVESEVGAVMQALQGGGVDQTALHNHLLGESPHVMYMHVMARGNAAAIASTIRRALAVTGTPMTTPAAVPVSPAMAPDTAGIARVLRLPGRLNGGVYQVSVPRLERITMMGEEVPPSMGVATAINFQPTGKSTAAITGDFVLLADEVRPVMRALRSSGITITALHSHMIDEQPRLFFMHFWGNADSIQLARALRAALDLVPSKAASVR